MGLSGFSAFLRGANERMKATLECQNHSLTVFLFTTVAFPIGKNPLEY
jgi:hypothetical protein